MGRPVTAWTTGLLSALLISSLSACPKAPATGAFEAITYNIAGLPQGISGSQPEAYIPLISAKLNSYDLALLQEDFAYHQAVLLDVDHPHISAHKEASSRFYGDGLTRLSRFPFTGLQRIQWSGCSGLLDGASDCLAEKGFSAAWHQLGTGLELMVVNHHAEAGGGPEDNRVRKEGFEQLAAFLEAEAPGAAVLIGGDNNLHGHTEPDETVLTTFLSRLNLEDACRHLNCGTEHIDRFFFRSGSKLNLEMANWRVPAEFVTADGEKLSDHDPIALRVKWRETKH